MPRVTIWDGGWGAGSPQTVTTAIAAEVANKVPGMGGGGPSPATARVTLAGAASTYLTPSVGRQRITVEGAINGSYETIFTGLTLGPTESNFPHLTEIEASGYLSLAQAPLNANKSYGAANGFTSDGPIIRDLLAASGVSEYSVTGTAATLYAAAGHVLRVPAWSAALNAIAELSRATLVPIYDARDGQVTYDRSYVGSYASEWTYKEGSVSGSQLPGWNWKRPRIWGTARNLIRVLGYIPSDPTIARPNAGRRASSALAPVDYVVETVPADCLESDADCSLLATAYAQWRNRQEDLISFTTVPSPYLEPMVCIDIASAPSLGISSTKQYVVLGVRHSVAASWVTEVTALATTLGELGSAYSLAPVPAFSATYSSFSNEFGVLMRRYTCDGRGSTDAEGQDYTGLREKWTVNAVSQQFTDWYVRPETARTPFVFVFDLPEAVAFFNNTIVTLAVTSQEGISASLGQNV